MSALYARNMVLDANADCWDFSTDPKSVPEICYQAIRNWPVEGKPAFVVWPRTKREVAHSVRFAVKHNLCIAVAGTGHDFLNRHSCTSAPFFLIRMTFLKGATFNLSDRRGGKDGSVTFGAGLVFGETHSITSSKGYYVASGWAKTVGVVGWALGGGHGPFGSSAGLGASNIIEAEVVTADGIWIKVNNESNADLWWALTGGGGSTWGVVVSSITVPLHKNPAGGITVARVTLGDAMSSKGPDGSSTLKLTLGAYLRWHLKLSSSFSGFAFFSSSKSDTNSPVPYWTAFIQYVCLGSEAEVMPGLSSLISSLPALYTVSKDIKNYKNYYQVVSTYSLEQIYPFPVVLPSSTSFPGGDDTEYVGGVTSVLVNRSVIVSGEIQSLVLSKLEACIDGTDRCLRQEFYDDVASKRDSPPYVDVSLSQGMKDASIHLVIGGYNQSSLETSYYKLGSNSYFFESSYHQPDWKYRYWGANYDRLLSIKKKYDPFLRFGCRHCIGDETP